MPSLDVAELLIDPDIAGDLFDVVRRPQTVSDQGRGVIRPQTFPRIRGAVYPSGNQSLVRADAYEHGTKSMEVVTRFRLRGASQVGDDDQFQPDLILWAGEYFIVKDVEDYSRYGAGFIKAGCLSFDYNDEAPRSLDPALGILDFETPTNSGLVGAIA